MKRYKNIEMIEAYKKGGFRERFAMENGKKKVIFVNGSRSFKFTYSSEIEYQDANGATYDTKRKQWIS